MENWTYILTWGKDLELYGQGDRRKVVDLKTNKVIFSYTITRNNLRQVILRYA